MVGAAGTVGAAGAPDGSGSAGGGALSVRVSPDTGPAAASASLAFQSPAQRSAKGVCCAEEATWRPGSDVTRWTGRWTEKYARLVTGCWGSPSTAVGAEVDTVHGARFPQLALSASDCALHLWPKTLSLSALRRDVGSSGRYARQNSL
eukprot:scaffold61144_cov61-Phaeocystis_antarctica.AAC.7